MRRKEHGSASHVSTEFGEGAQIDIIHKKLLLFLSAKPVFRGGRTQHQDTLV